MLRAIEIENFMSIGTRQRVEFAPITLLVGPNSAGKSTVIRALSYVHDLVATRDADVEVTQFGLAPTFRGPFHRVVHLHDVTKRVRLRVEFALDPALTLNVFDRDMNATPFPDLAASIRGCWMEFEVSAEEVGEDHGALRVVAIGVNDQPTPVVWLALPWRIEHPSTWAYAHLNLDHPIFADSFVCPEGEDRRTAFDEVLGRWEAAGDCPGYAGWFAYEYPPGDMDTIEGHIPAFTFRSHNSALPPAGEPILASVSEGSRPDHEREQRDVGYVLEILVLGLTRQLTQLLGFSLQVGPIRATPRFGRQWQADYRELHFGDGTMSWELLGMDWAEDILESCNAWLARMGIGYSLVYFRSTAAGQAGADVAAPPNSSEAEVDHRAFPLLRAPSGMLLQPSEVGTGVSQVVPIVAACAHAHVAGALRVLALQQPELHLHPAAQVELGDLLIFAAVVEEARHCVVVETHSEHLILRLLRRIRETSGGELPNRELALRPSDLAVYYVERVEAVSVVNRLRVDEDGEFLDRWPQGFFGERAKELF